MSLERKTKVKEAVNAFIGVARNGDLFLVIQEGAGSAYYRVSKDEYMRREVTDLIIPSSKEFKLMF